MTLDSNEPDRRLEVLTSFVLDPPLRPGEDYPTDAEIAVVADDGTRISFDPGDARAAGLARVIESLREQRRPVSLELDDDGRIGRVLIPHVSPVERRFAIDRGVIGVVLLASHGRHALRDAHPRFDELLATVDEAIERGATVIVTEDDAHDILDVRFSDDPDLDRPVPIEPPPEVWWKRLPFVSKFVAALHAFFSSCRFPWGLWRALSASKAQQVFDDLAARSCDPLTVPPPCIPFRYPDDGCWGRAHEMCRIMVDQGLHPRKVWIEGSLHVATANNPSCGVWWGWHVAPTHCVRGSGWFGWFRLRELVFDPALFSTPVTKATWKGVQGDTGATLTDKVWPIFYLWGTGSGTSWFSLYDPAFTQTNSVLAAYRAQLQSRSIQVGPPPYACP